MHRFHQAVLIGSLLALSWLLMQAVHEFGHVAAAWGTGGAVERVVLHPLTISRTDVMPNPEPLIVAWGGPLIGSLLPLAAWAVAVAARLCGAFLWRFFAGFCLIANGVYLGAGSFGEIGDAGDILRHGSPEWLLWVFGLATAASGLWLWNGIGPEFGYGAGARPVSAIFAYTCAGVLLIAIAIELLCFA